MANFRRTVDVAGNVRKARDALIDVVDKDTPLDIVNKDQVSDRLQIRLSPDNYIWLVNEAKRTGNTMSGLASLAVADWIEERQKKREIKLESK